MNFIAIEGEELKFDKNGNAIPQYELKRKMTTSKNKKFTSGQNKLKRKKVLF